MAQTNARAATRELFHLDRLPAERFKVSGG